jgi:hypothetical protein
VAYDVKAVKRQWEGYETPRQWGRYPVEQEPIVRWPNFLGETIAVRGRVRKTIAPDRVELELWIENAGEVTVPATATVILPAS